MGGSGISMKYPLGKTKSPEDYASKAPTQTPDQAEMSGVVKPYLKDWMTNPPKVTSQDYTPTKITYGGGGQSQRQQAPAAFGSGGQFQSQVMDRQSGQQGFAQQGGAPTQNFAYSQGGMGQVTTGSGKNKSSEKQYIPGQATIAEAPTGLNTEGMSGGYEQNNRWNQPINQLGQPISNNTSSLNGLISQIGNAFRTGNGGYRENNSQDANIAQIGQGISNNTSELNGLISQIGQSFRAGANAGYRENNSQRDAINNLNQNPYGGYSATNNAGMIDAASQPLTDQSRRISAIEAPINQPYAQDYSNGLENTVQNRLTSNMDRKLQEGYDASYLKDLAAQGVDPLNDAYKEAIRTAGADFNRMGLGGSGFELGNKYGDQADSITSRYLKSVGDVARSVGIQGAEAARADRFANANLQDSATSQVGSLAQQQGANQLNRLQSDVSRDLQNKDLTNQALQLTQNQELQNRNLAQQRLANTTNQQQTNESNRQFWTGNDQQIRQNQIGLNNQLDQQNEAMRQYWNQNEQNLDQQSRAALQNQLAAQQWQTSYGREGELANKDLLKTQVGLQNQADQQNEANRQYWTQADQNAMKDQLSAQQWQASFGREGELANKDLLKAQIGLGQANDQQNESNRQFWANKSSSDRQYDNNLERQNWQDNLNVAQWLIGRDDEAQRMNIEQNLGLQKDNIQLQQQAIANVMNFINGQQAQASALNSNYWTGVNQANAAKQNQMNTLSTIAGLFL